MDENLTREQELELEVIAEKEANLPNARQEAIFAPTQRAEARLSTSEEARLEVLQQQESEALKAAPNKIPTIEPDLKVSPGIISGTPNGERIDGTQASDNITALGGDDQVFGKAGDDIISGGGENDSIKGNSGRDLIFGDFSASENSGLVGSGNDTIYGNDGNDLLYGQNREDIIYGGKGRDFAEGGDGNDLVKGNQGKDTLYGDSFEGEPFSTVSGDDTVIGGGGSDLVFGGKGNDSLEGNNGKDELTGGQGNDILDGGNGKDKLIGTDTVFFAPQQFGFGAGEKDTLTGGKNNDTFVLGLAEALTRQPDGTDGTVQDVVLYDDGNINNNGTQGFALIKDFGFPKDGVSFGVDKIQLTGSESMYSLGASPVGGISGTGIFLEEGQNTPELIGLVEGISLDTLSLSDSTQFVFV
ncbi:MAG: hypothetical protein AAF915_11555 [Cyanobacteria bacterium P01_D01_bin.50]